MAEWSQGDRLHQASQGGVWAQHHSSGKGMGVRPEGSSWRHGCEGSPRRHECERGGSWQRRRCHSKGPLRGGRPRGAQGLWGVGAGAEGVWDPLSVWDRVQAGGRRPRSMWDEALRGEA